MFQSQGSGLYSRFLHVWFAIFPKKLLILRHAQAYWSALKFNLGKKCAEHNSIRSVHLICAQTYVKHSCMLARGHTLRVIIQPLGPCFYSLDLLLILPNDPRLSNDFMVVYLLFFLSGLCWAQICRSEKVCEVLTSTVWPIIWIFPSAGRDTGCRSENERMEWDRK